MIISIEVLLHGLNYIDGFLSEPNVSFLICICSYDDKDDYSEQGSTHCLNEVFIFIQFHSEVFAESVELLQL